MDDARNFATSAGRGWLTNFTCGVLFALENRAIRERAEQRAEAGVGRVRAADVLRDEAEERERVADGERRRIRAGYGFPGALSRPLLVASQWRVKIA